MGWGDWECVRCFLRNGWNTPCDNPGCGVRMDICVPCFALVMDIQSGVKNYTGQVRLENAGSVTCGVCKADNFGFEEVLICNDCNNDVCKVSDEFTMGYIRRGILNLYYPHPQGAEGNEGDEIGVVFYTLHQHLPHLTPKLVTFRLHNPQPSSDAYVMLSEACDKACDQDPDDYNKILEQVLPVITAKFGVIEGTVPTGVLCHLLVSEGLISYENMTRIIDCEY